MAAPIQDGELDRAIDPGYSAISTLAVLGLALGLLSAIGGAAAIVLAAAHAAKATDYPAVFVLAAPAAALALSLLGYRRIRRSHGVLAGRRIAVAGIVLGAAATLLAAGAYGSAWWTERSTLGDLRDRAYAVIDDMLAGRYEAVYEQMPEDFRGRQASGAKEFRDRFADLLGGAGRVVGRDLVVLQVLTTDKGDTVAPADLRVEFERRILEVTVWFHRAGDGSWELVGVGGQETFESAARFASEKGPAAVPAPFQRSHGHDH